MKPKTFTLIVPTLLLTIMLLVNIQPVKLQQPSQTNSVVLEFDFPPLIVTKDSVYASVAMQGLPKHGAPGEPILPFRTVKILIPQGNNVQSIDVTASNRTVLKGRFDVEYGKTPLPISSNVTFKDQPSQAIYGSADPFPGTLFSHASEQHLRGYKILMLKLHPVQHIPRTGELSYFERMTVTVNTMVSSHVSSLFRDLQQDRELVLDIVDNPSEVESYTNTATLTQPMGLVNPLDSHDYVIITNNALKASFQPLVDWKNQKGLKATIVLMEDIMNDPNYHCDGLFGDGYGTQFNSTQAHVRNFIKNAYINWETKYVLLGGDDEIIPARGVYAYTSGYYLGNGDTDYNMPCDMYYGALDGSWDNDNDTIFAEGVCHYADEGPENGTAGEEADFFAEVYIGRATVDTVQEAANFVRKTLAYEQNPNASYLKKALMIGQTLDAGTEGGDGKDLVTNIIPQYTTTRLYSRDGTFSRSAVINEMNNGTHIINDNGHANYRIVMGLYRSDVTSLINTEYFMAYSIGCYSAAFDSATSGTGEAIGEHFVTSNGGAFAYIGNSRYGLYLPNSSDGPGDRYDRSFFEVLSEGTRNLGKALQLSKEKIFDELDRWTYFNLNLLGDPETEIVTNITAPTAHFETRTGLLPPPLYGGNVPLRGTAKRGTTVDSTFSNYTIEFGVGTNPTFWSSTGIALTENGENEVVNGTLGFWNTSLVNYGNYTLKLTVSDAEGNLGKDWTIIIISRQHSLAIYSSPTKVTFTVNGLPRTTPWSGTYTKGTSVSIVMPETHDGHSWSCWLEDKNTNRIKTVTMDTNITLTGVFAPDTTPPSIFIASPENRTYPENEVPLTFTISESTSWIGYSLNSQMNLTISGNTTLIGLSDKTYTITVYANDTAGNSGHSDTVSFAIDTAPPNIVILSPQNKTYMTSSVSLNFTVDEATSWIGYSLNSQMNLTIIENTTLSKLHNGLHNLTIYAKDTAGNVGTSETLHFTIKIHQAEPSQLRIIVTIAIAIIELGAGTILLAYFIKIKKTNKP